PFRALKGGGASVAFSPDSKRIASAGADGAVKVWDAETQKEQLTLQGHTASVESVAFSPDGKRVASASHDRPVKESDADSGKDVKRLASAGKHWEQGSPEVAEVKVWDARTGEELRCLKGGGDSVAFSPDGKRLYGARNHLGDLQAVAGGDPPQRELVVAQEV